MGPTRQVPAQSSSENSGIWQFPSRYYIVYYFRTPPFAQNRKTFTWHFKARVFSARRFQLSQDFSRPIFSEPFYFGLGSVFFRGPGFESRPTNFHPNPKVSPTKYTLEIQMSFCQFQGLSTPFDFFEIGLPDSLQKSLRILFFVECEFPTIHIWFEKVKCRILNGKIVLT